MGTNTVSATLDKREKTMTSVDEKRDSLFTIFKIYLAIMALAAGAFVLSVGIEIVLLWVLNMIGVTLFAVIVALAAVASLAAPFLVIVWYGFLGILDDIDSKRRIVFDVLLVLLCLTIWTFAAKEMAFGAYNLLLHLEEIGIIAFPESFRVIPL